MHSKQKQLEMWFQKLAEKEIEKEKLEIVSKELENILDQNFRPMYSNLFEIVKNKKEDLNTLMTNMQLLYEYIHNHSKNQELLQGITRLNDHLNLDVATITRDAELNKKFEEADKKFYEIDELKIKIQAMQKDYITILGIFSAIVITFVAGLVFSSSVLENIKDVSIYRLLLIIWCIAFAIISILQGLYRFIENILYGKQITTYAVLLTIFAIITIFISGIALIYMCYCCKIFDSF